ncbi:CBS domain-containing protein [Rhodocaloribacter litoris]|uniref:CBS domain-containing protein n=1 Tax=Rhodocaloribacter litoris TaxID=2558931 RepID=UPI001E60DB01|nr:glutamate-cysteine ligase family protein [Rhodocaloribacter litoris]
MRRFTRHLIQDVQALEYMLQENLFETGVRRVGAEQELFLVDERFQPAPVAKEILDLNTDPRLGTELTRFNLEYNLQPYVFTGDCLRRIEHEINEMLQYVRSLSRQVGAEVVLVGILPTVHLSDLGLDNMAPMPRYFALNDAIMRLRGGRPAQYQIRGVDELFFQHDNILVEGCNTSFQTHFQVSPEAFPHCYNIAQLIAAPCLAAATNSPVLFGKRLWRETRIALFQQAVDTRSSNLYLREMSPRVHFGTDWCRESVTEIYKEDIARFRVLLITEQHEDPFQQLDRGEVPNLRALQVHNSTVYRWNRACYGITDGKPHLRIENRILPSGPTVVDEVANAAFWFGLVQGLSKKYQDIPSLMDFDFAKSNFVAAARLGLAAQLVWLHGEQVPAPELICDELLPVAREGLAEAGIDAADIDRYLGVIEERVESQQTGSVWQIHSLALMKRQGTTRAERLSALVEKMIEAQQEGKPAHTWPLATFDAGSTSQRMAGTRVEHFMSTDLFTVHEEELVEFVAVLMDWRRIRHVVVEDNDHRLVGLVTHRRLLRYLAESSALSTEQPRDVPVRDIMIRNPISVTPETRTVEAIRLMRQHGIGALPVVRDGQLVGIITEADFIRIAGQLIDESLRADEAGTVEREQASS